MITRVYQKYKQVFAKWPTGHQFIKFSAVGFFNSILDFSTYIGLTRFFAFWREYYLGANIIAFIIGTTSSFFLNKYFTFKNDATDVARQYMRFWIVAIIYIVLTQCILYIGVSVFELYDVAAKILAMGIGLFWNFFAHKYWSFRQEKGMMDVE